MKNILGEAKFILIFFGIMTVLSGFSNLDLEPDRQIKPTNLKPQIENSAEVEWVTRVPASIKEKADSSKGALVLEKNFFCNHSLMENKQSAQVSNSLVMLSFKICKETKQIERVQLTNETNGFKAQIFKSEDNKYKSDYIQLNSGSNKIILEVILKDGQKNTDSLVIVTGS